MSARNVGAFERSGVLSKRNNRGRFIALPDKKFGKINEIIPLALHTFLVDNFCVEGPLLGRSHSFVYEARRISVTLPTLAKIKADTECGQLSSYLRGPRGGVRDARYKVSQVTLSVPLSERFRVPVKLPNAMKNPYEALSKDEQTRLHEAVKACGPIACNAFRQWLRVLQWKTGRGLLGRSIVENYESSHGGSVIDPRNNRNLGYGYNYMAVPAEQLILVAHWKEAGKALRAGEEPPIWIMWLLDGELAESNGNRQGAAANYAIACESFLLAKFFEEIPASVNPDVLNIIQIQVHGRSVLNKFATKRFPHLKSSDQSLLNKLFDLRNKLMHRGKSNQLTETDCQGYRKVVFKLIYGMQR